MGVYLFGYLILLLLSFKEIMIPLKRNSPIFFVSIFTLLFSVVAGIRYGIGTDFFTYLSIFNNVNHYEDYNYLEPGFRFIISTLKQFGFSGQSLFLVFALISLSFLFVGLKKTSQYPIFSSFLFMLTYYIGYVFNGVRQGLVMCVFIYLINDIEKRNFRKVLIFTLLGMSIHSSAIFIILAYFFYTLKVSIKHYFILGFISLVLFLFRNIWGNYIVNFMPSIVVSKLSIYTENFNSEVDALGIIQRTMILIPFFIYYSKLKAFSKFEGVFRIYFLGFIFYCLFSFQEMFATRINMMFRILEIILFPYLLKINIHKIEKLFLLLLIIIWATLIFITEMKNPMNYPYVSVFD